MSLRLKHAVLSGVINACRVDWVANAHGYGHLGLKLRGIVGVGGRMCGVTYSHLG